MHIDFQKGKTLCFFKGIFSFQDNLTPLHLASKQGDIVHMHYAFKHNYSEVVQVLVSHGATVDIKDKVRIWLH